MSRSTWIGVMIALGLGLALRLTSPEEVCDLRPRADALEYDLASGALARGEGYVLPLDEHAYPPRYTIGYPLLVAAGRLIFSAEHEPGFGVVISVLAGLLVIVCGALLASELGGARAAIAAALLLALSPLQIFHARQPMSDAAALALLFASLALALRWARSPRLKPRTAWTIGALAAFGATVRVTNGLALPILFMLVLTRPFAERRLRLEAVFGFVVGCFVGLAPQALVNWKQHGEVLRSGYSYWIPSVYGAGEVRGARAIGASLSLDFSNYGAYARQLAGFDSLLEDLRRTGLGTAPAAPAAPTPPSETRPPRAADDVLLHRGLEPAVLYPFPIALLALLGLGLRGRGGNVARASRALRVLGPLALAFFVFYGAYSFRELRFLLPLQALVLVIAARAFSTARPRLLGAACVLAAFAGLSALPDIAAASRPMQSRAPYGRTNEESLALRWIAEQVEPEAIVAVRTHAALFERELLGTSAERWWVPIGRDEHRIRIEALGLERSAPLRRDLTAARRAELARYRPLALDLDASAVELLTLRGALLARARPLDETARRAAVELLERLPADALDEETRYALATRLGRSDLRPEELGLAIFELAHFALLQSFASDLEAFGALLARHPERPAYLADLYLFEYVVEERDLRRLFETGRVPGLTRGGAPRERSLAPHWIGLEKIGSFRRPGQSAALPEERACVALYRVKRS